MRAISGNTNSQNEYKDQFIRHSFTKQAAPEKGAACWF
jgi:hypothetical protein